MIKKLQSPADDKYTIDFITKMRNLADELEDFDLEPNIVHTKDKMAHPKDLVLKAIFLRFFSKV